MSFFLLCGALFAAVIAVTSGNPGQAPIDTQGLAFAIACGCTLLAILRPVAKVFARSGRRLY